MKFKTNIIDDPQTTPVHIATVHPANNPEIDFEFSFP